MRLVIALLLCIWMFGPMPSTLEAAQATQPDFNAIDAYIESEMQANRVPGVALAIVRSNQIMYMRGFGTTGAGEAVTPQSAFILGSMSKSFTALAAMQQVEQGRLALNAPVQRYLPWFRVADPAASARITVQQLLNHTSGIPTRAPHASSELRDIDAHVRALATVELAHEPGSAYAYSSPNYLVVAAIVQQITGQPYAAYVQQYIFTPLAMRHSFTAQDAAMQSTMVRGHRYLFGFPFPAVLPYEADRMPTAALISSAEDLGHYLIAQLNAGRYADQAILSPSGMTQLHQPTTTAENDDLSYAMGWRAGTIGGVPAVHHGGVVSHFSGKMVLLPEQGWGVVLLTNASTLLPLPLTSHRMADTVAAALVGTALPDPVGLLPWVSLGVGIGIAALTFDQIKGLFRLNRWRAQLPQRALRPLVIELVIRLALPVGVLIGLPALLDIPLQEIVRAMPDIGYWLIASTVVGILSGLWKCMVAYTALRAR